MVEVHGRTLEQLWDSCLDTAAFAAVGYLSGRAVNWFMQLSSAPSFFTQSTQMDLKSSAVCCGLFILIDRLAHTILTAMIGRSETNKPVYSAVRIALSAAAAINLLNLVASSVKLASVERNAAVAVILTAIVIYNHTFFYLLTFNQRHIAVEIDRDFDAV